jgi:hypothetical protein
MQATSQPGAPKSSDQIEITLEMINAAVGVLMDMYDAVGGPVDEAIAVRIFKAMVAKRAVRANRRS